MYEPQHEVTISPYPMGPPQSPFVFGALCTCKWLWMPNTYANTAEAVQIHYTAASLLVASESQ